jgi:hypothetical protein
MNTPPTRPPTASELLAHPAVIQAMDEAWGDSQVNEPDDRHEEGGWIYMDLATAGIVTRRAPTGARSRLSLANPPLVPNHLIVGTFHTHPHPASEGWTTEPSAQDAIAARHTGVPWLIRAEDGNHCTGPDRRRGGLGGGTGYPN